MFDPKKLMEMMKQAKSLSEEMQKELEHKRVEGTAGGGMVTLEMNGKMEVTSLKIDPAIVNKDEVAFLEDLVRGAVNDACMKVRDMVAEQTRSMSSKFGLPL